MLTYRFTNFLSIADFIVWLGHHNRVSWQLKYLCSQKLYKNTTGYIEIYEEMASLLIFLPQSKLLTCVYVLHF